MPDAVPVVILGATGYVGGELLRLIGGHPHLELEAACSTSRAGSALIDTFPHLAGRWDGTHFRDMAEITWSGSGPVAVFSCLPHGEAAAILDGILREAEAVGRDLKVVDLSADFRLGTAEVYEEVYGRPHGAPERCGEFTCALPELTASVPLPRVAHPGCFTTAVTLSCAPFQAQRVCRPAYAVSAVTGSTGSGRSPSPTTHHPERHGSLKAYNPLRHRHAAEMQRLLAELGGEAPTVAFVPHSGPFARGIHATVHLELAEERTAADLASLVARYYESSPFVTVSNEPPRLKDVVGTNRCRLAVAAAGRRAVVVSVIDNLTKGAAGGAVQWMNRLCGWEETLGLDLVAVGWQ